MRKEKILLQAENLRTRSQRRFISGVLGGRWLHLMLSNVATAVALGLVAVFLPSSASAIDTVYSPAVELGEVELEARSTAVVSGPNEHEWASRLGLGYAPTDTWMLEGYGEFIREPSDNLEVQGWSIETRYELTEPGAYLLDWGLYGEFTGTTRGRDPEKIEGKLLVERSTPHLTGTLNLILEQEVGSARENDLEGGLAFVARYKASTVFEPGIELHSEFGELNHAGSFDDQEHLIGPCVWGELTSRLGYEFAWLLGVSKSADNQVARVALEYEF